MCLTGSVDKDLNTFKMKLIHSRVQINTSSRFSRIYQQILLKALSIKMLSSIIGIQLFSELSFFDLICSD